MELWPVFDLRLFTPALELGVPRESELPALCQVAKDGIHDPAWMPFAAPWTDQPSPQFERGFVQHWAHQLAEFSPQRWNLNLCVFHEGRPVGVQGLGATDFAKLRQVGTGSWLGREFQGKGIGKQMRAAVLELAFSGLGAEVATSEASNDNAASIGVSRSLGYEDNGVGRIAPRGTPQETIRFVLHRHRWTSPIDVRIEGLDACRDLFG